MGNPQHEKLSAKERAIYEQQKRRQAHENKKRAKAKWKNFSRILILALIAALLFFVVLSLSLFKNFSSSPEKYDYSMKITYDGEKFKSFDDVSIHNNSLYFSLNSMAEILGCKIMGDVSEMSCVFEDGSVITFFIDTNVYSVNGLTVYMNDAPYFSGMDGDVYVPVEFFAGSFNGIELTGNKRGKKIKYTLNISEDFAASYSHNLPSEPISPDEALFPTLPGTNFISYLSEYEKYMNPENRDEYIYLINTENSLEADYVPEDLIEISYTRKDRAAAKMREYAAKALDAMFIEMRAYGFTDVSVTSAYRSYEYQKQLFDNRLAGYLSQYDYATAYAKTASMQAIPGTSEHQSGLCADLHNLPAASQAFEAQDAFDWLVEHCADFGFILRFPKDKQDITGIIYEPWHYRYVGRYHAQKIMQSGLCLEEYCELNGY